MIETPIVKSRLPPRLELVEPPGVRVDSVPNRMRALGPILVPIIRGQTAAAVLSLADSVARMAEARGLVLALVEIPATWLGLATSAAARAKELLRWIAMTDYERPTGGDSRLGIQTRITTDVARSVREAALETNTDVVVLEWPLVSSPRRHRLEALMREFASDPPTNLVLARPDPSRRGQRIAPKTVLVPLRGGANARLALAVATALAAEAGAALTVLHVYNLSHHRDRREREAAEFGELLDSINGPKPDVLELVSRKPAETLLTTGQDFDAVVMGAHALPGSSSVLVGPAIASVIRRLSKTVILTRAARAGFGAA